MTAHNCETHPVPDMSCYTHCRCRCDGCKAAKKRYGHELAQRRKAGPVSVPRCQVRAHLEQLTRLGVAPAAISRASGVRPESIRRVLDRTKTRPVPAAAARKLLAVRPETLDGSTCVDSRFAVELIVRLRARGLTRNEIAVRGLGWSCWPGDHCWPHARVQLSTVAALRRLVGEVESVCATCGRRPPMAGGARDCLSCFQAGADPRLSPSWDPKCGTRSGYNRHHRAGERPCDDCKAARRSGRQAAPVSA